VWAQNVLTAVDAPQGTTSPLYYYGYWNNWVQGQWYVQQTDGGYAPSPDQNPRAGVEGRYVRYDGTNKDGNNVVSEVGNGAPGSGNPAAPSPDTPDAGNAVPPGAPPPDNYIRTITRDDGTIWTEMVLPPGSPLNVPPNAVVIPNTDGTYLVLYNNDGSAWNPNPTSGGEGDGSGSGGGDPPGTQPDDGGTTAG
jgi:hypothetical protein